MWKKGRFWHRFFVELFFCAGKTLKPWNADNPKAKIDLFSWGGVGAKIDLFLDEGGRGVQIQKSPKPRPVSAARCSGWCLRGFVVVSWASLVRA